MTTVFDVARYILGRKVDGMDAMKLHKLCYYAQAWHLAWEGKALFDDHIAAWRDGPVVRNLYRAQKYEPELLDGDFTVSEQQALVIDRVLAAYGMKSPRELSDLTHREAPWRIARGSAKPDEKTDETIPHESILAFFSGLAKSSAEWIASESFEDAAAAVALEHSEALRRLA